MRSRSFLALSGIVAIGSVLGGVLVPVLVAPPAFAVPPVPGATDAPDAVSLAFRAGADASHVAIDVTWDQVAVADSGGSGSAYVITLDGVAVECLTPATGSATPSGGTTAGGNNTTLWTLTCGAITEGLYAGAVPSATNSARLMIVGDSAKDVTDSFFNSLEQVNIATDGRTTSLPDLVNFAVRLNVVGASGNPVDEAVFTFSDPLASINAFAALGVVPSTGGGDATILDSSGPFPGDAPVVDGSQVRAYFPVGTLNTVVKAYADAEAVIAAGSGVLNAATAVPLGGWAGGGADPAPFGTVRIDGGATAVSHQSVTLTFPGTDARTTQVSVSNHADMSAAQTYAYTAGLQVTWLLAGFGDGTRQSVHVTFTDGTLTSVAHEVSVLVDRSAPVMGALAAPRMFAGGIVGSTVPLYLSWAAATDSVSSVVKYDVARSVDGGAFAVVGTTTTRSFIRSVVPNHRYRFRVRAYDVVGNVSAGAVTSEVRASVAQDRSTALTYAGAWSTTVRSTALGGTFRSATATGASVTYRFSGRQIGWIAPTSLTYGSARVYVDGRLVATVNLALASTARRIDYVKHWTTVGTHTIRIAVVGTAGHPRVTVDAFVTLR